MEFVSVIQELVAEIIEESEIPKRVALHAVVEAAVEVKQQQNQELGRRNLPPELLIGEALNKIKTVNIIDGDPIPAHQLEALKELIKKVALRKIKRIQEEQLEKAGNHARTKKS